MNTLQQYTVMGEDGKEYGPVNVEQVRAWIAEESGLPPWLVDDSYAQVGDLAETLTLLLDDPPQPSPDRPLAEWIEQHLLAVANQPEVVRRAAVVVHGSTTSAP